MKKQTKRLEVSIEYNDRLEVIECLRRLVLEIKKNRSNFGRQKINDSFIDWSINSTEFVDMRVENINGNRCIIIPSKMNEL